MQDKKQASSSSSSSTTTVVWPTLRQTQSVNQYTQVKPPPFSGSSLEAVTLRPSTEPRRSQSKWARYSFNPNVIVLDKPTVSCQRLQQHQKQHNQQQQQAVVPTPVTGLWKQETTTQESNSAISKLIKIFHTDKQGLTDNNNSSNQADDMHTILEYRQGRLNHQLGPTKGPVSDKRCEIVPLTNGCKKTTCQIKNGNHVISPETLISYRSGKSIDIPNKKSTRLTTSTTTTSSNNNNNNNNSVAGSKDFMIKVAKGDLTTSISIHPLPPPNDQRSDQVTDKNRINSTKEIRFEPPPTKVSVSKSQNGTQMGMEQHPLNFTHLNNPNIIINSNDTSLKCDGHLLPVENEANVSKVIFRNNNNNITDIGNRHSYQNKQFKSQESAKPISSQCILSSGTTAISSSPPATMGSARKESRSQDTTPPAGQPQHKSISHGDILSSKNNYRSNDDSAFNMKDQQLEKTLQNEIANTCPGANSKSSSNNGQHHETHEIKKGTRVKHLNSAEDYGSGSSTTSDGGPDEDDEGTEDVGAQVNNGFFMQENNNETTADRQDAGANLEASFRGHRNYLIPEKPIRSNKGTVRGIKNRVRAGIETFRETSDGNKKYHQTENNKVVVYTTTNGIIRETFQKCLKVKTILSTLLVQFEERDIFKSKAYQRELAERTSSDLSVPQVFLEGFLLGGVTTIENLNENGRLREIMKPYKRPGANIPCRKCGGYNLLLCNICNGSKKSIHRNRFTEAMMQLRCGQCDECGLIQCDLCSTSAEKIKS